MNLNSTEPPVVVESDFVLLRDAVLENGVPIGSLNVVRTHFNIRSVKPMQYEIMGQPKPLKGMRDYESISLAASLNERE